MKQKLTNERRNNNSIITAIVFNTPLLIINRTTRQEINEEIEDLSNTIKSISQLDLRNIYI